MMELDESFSLNDRYLIDEYLKNGTDDFLLFGAGDKTFVVPYKYTIGAKSPEEAIDKCKKALFDFQNEEITKYKNAKEKPKILCIDGVDIVVAKKYAGAYSEEQCIKKFLEKAKAKYDTAINTHRALSLLNMTSKPVDVSGAAIEKNVHNLSIMGEGVLLANSSPELIKICKFIEKAGNKGLEKFKTSTTKLAQALEQMVLKNEFRQLKKYRPKHWKTALLSMAIATAGYQGGKTFVEHFFNNDTNEIQKTKENPYVYTDCFGKEHADTLGNLKLMNRIKPEITALIFSIEGYTENAFLEGGERPTVGSGFTKYIDENGMETSIKMGDTTNPLQNQIQINRYLDLYFCNLLGDNVGKALSKTEILTCIGAGICWGPDGFGKSSFFQSIKDNEHIDVQQRKLTGFRTPIGLIKREYLLAKVLSGEWNVKDLLDMPIYLIKGQGYLHCGIYPPDFHHYLPCKKDKNGNYVLDEHKNEKPLICDDGFCMSFTKDHDKKMLKRIVKQAKKGRASYKTVREMIGDDMCRVIENSNAALGTNLIYDMMLKASLDHKSNSL